MEAFRKVALWTGVLGTIVFGVALAASLLNPAFVERTAAQIIRYQVEKAVHQRIEALDAGFLMQKARELMERNAEETRSIKQQLTDRLPERIARITAEMQNLDCECRKKIEKSIKSGFEFRIGSLAEAQERLQTLVRTKYMETAEKLTREFRVFTGTNAAVFLSLVMICIIKRQAHLHFLPATVVLVGAAGLTAYLYLFHQNWLHTVLFSNYVGFAYVGYLGLAIGFLADILLNRARVTVRILNGIGQIFSHAPVLSPC